MAGVTEYFGFAVAFGGGRGGSRPGCVVGAGGDHGAGRGCVVARCAGDARPGCWGATECGPPT